MNTFSAINVDYITPCRTIENILVKNEKGDERIVFVYNYEGYHYRIFNDVIELAKFLNGEDFRILAEYTTERGLDNFLSKMNIKT